MSRLSEIFATHEKCFVSFVTAGHPDLEATEEIVLELARVGSHIVEIGIPFSDPIADGPVIQHSSFQALRHNYTMSDYVELVRRVRRQTEAGLVFMTYINPVLRYGMERLEDEAGQAGLDGILISDLTPEEYGLMKPIEKLDTVFLAAPTSSDRRLERICRASRGFIYLVARTGVTGNHSDLQRSVPATVARLRRLTNLPIAVGFGIRSWEDVQKVWQWADAAVVGSAIVQFIDEHQEESQLAERVGEYLKTHLLSPAD